MRKSAAFIDEPVAVDVHDETEGVGVLLEKLGDDAVTKGRGVEVPSHSVTATPVAVGLGADVQGHLDAVAGVVGDAPHLGQFPALA